MKGNKVTTIRINEEILETLKCYSEAEGKSQTDFLNELLTKALSEYFLERSGGAVLRIPNPQFEEADPEKYNEALKHMSIATINISQLSIGMIPLLHNILAFYSQRLFSCSPDERKRYKQNHIVDSTQSDIVTDI